MRDENYNIRINNLEKMFGDPWDKQNPIGISAILKADEKQEMLESGEKLLDEYGLNAELIPVNYGGRLTRVDHLIQIMRSVYRHDPCLGLGYGGSSFIASCNIWATGTEEQCQEVAQLMLKNRKLACSYYELSHGNDLTSIEFEAMTNGEKLILNGSKQITSNIQRADIIVIYARTDKGQGSRKHSLILVNKSGIPVDKMKYLPRFPSVGMRGVQLGGVEFKDCPLPVDRILGTEGSALETAIRSFQITRTALPGMFIGILDTGLRTLIRYAYKRNLYNKAVIQLPQVRTSMVDAFTDLLICDCFSTVVARSIHLLPRETSVYAPAIKYMVPKILIPAMNKLSSVLGAQFYLRNGEYSIFQKLLRDLKPIGFGHVARVACQMTILPQLPRLARQSWLTDDEAPDQIFELDGYLPPLSYKNLSIDAGGRDRLMGSLITGQHKVSLYPTDNLHQEILRLINIFITELKDLKRECCDLKPSDLTVMASPEIYDLSNRYATIIAASSCVNIWINNKQTDSFQLGNPAWIIAALIRLSNHINNQSEVIPEHIESQLFNQLLDRYNHAKSFDLMNRKLPGESQSLTKMNEKLGSL